MAIYGGGSQGMANWIFILSRNLNKGQTALYKDNIEMMNTYNYYSNLALNTFEWMNLPKTVDPVILEKILLENGEVSIVKDENYGFLGLPFRIDRTKNNDINIYGEPMSITAHSVNYSMSGKSNYEKTFTPYVRCGGDQTNIANAVVCKDNILSYPYSMYILMASLRSYESMRSIDVAVQKLRNPWVLISNQMKENEIRNYFQQLKNNEEVILVSDGLELDGMIRPENVAIDVAVVTALWEQYQRYQSHISEILGIKNNENIDKSERLLVDEVNANNQITDINIDLRLKSRLDFCKQFNELFGENISVKLRHQEFLEEFGDEPEEVEEPTKTDTEEVPDNE